MKIILSRKGFDSGYGGIPSPILPDGTMLSFPIPSEGDRIHFNDLQHQGLSYSTLMHQLSPHCKVSGNDECHLDPDIRAEIINRPEGWKPAFGQIGAAQSHLKNQGVGVGDVFLFFGWFRKTIKTAAGYAYSGPAQGFHAIYGYMQVGEIITSKDQVPDWLKNHPHATGERWEKNNAIYLPTERLSFLPELPGAGCLSYSDTLKLTKDGCCRSVWALPDFFKHIPITYNQDAWQGDEFHSAAKGQEFVFTATEDAKEWLLQVIQPHKKFIISPIDDTSGNDGHHKDCIRFDRPDYDTWALARIDHKLLKEIQDSPLWEREDAPDIPLTQEQMVSLVKGYSPDWDCRYAPYLLGGWFYITRSGHWVKKFRYKQGDDGYYHLTDSYTSEKEKGRNLLMEILVEGYFAPRIMDDRLRELFSSIERNQHYLK